jgi:phosphoribosylanthranilate isomerase
VTRIKICGVTDPDDARDAALLGADAIGLNFYDKSPRCIDAAHASRIIDVLPAVVSVVGVFVNHPDPWPCLSAFTRFSFTAARRRTIVR